MKFYKLFIIFIINFLVFSQVLSEELTLIAGPVTCEYKNNDEIEDYDETSDVNIKCNTSTCTINGSGATFSDNIVSITAAGTYIIQGTLNGQVHIEVTKNDFVHLVLNGISITSDSGPAIYGIKADKITITLIGENSLIDSENYTVVDEEPDACLFIASNLSINGSGSLMVTGNYSDGIRCKKDLRIISGNIKVPNAVERGIKAKNSVCIKDGTIDVNSINTAIKATKDTDALKGYVVIDGGSITVSSENDGIHAETHLTIHDGYINVLTAKEGLEGQMIDILGGEIHVLATDDGINASKISNSTETEFTFDDPNGMGGGIPDFGIDGSFSNNTNFTESTNNNPNGNMPDIGTDGSFSNNTNSTEFKPGHNGGSGGMGGGMQGGMQGGMPETGTDGSVYINIVGGKIYVTAEGMDVDGIDSNGVLYIGGEAEVYVSISNGDIYGFMAALDSEGTNAIVSSATVIATAGNMSDMSGMGGMGGMEGMKGMEGMEGTQESSNSQESSDTQEFSGSKGVHNGQGFPGGQDGQGFPGGQDGQGFPSGFLGGQDGQGFPGGFPGGQDGQGFPGGMSEEGTVYQAYIKTSIDSQNAGTQMTIKDSNNKVIISYTPNVSYSSILLLRL